MNSVTISMSEIADLPCSATPLEQQMLILLKEKGMPTQGTCLLSLDDSYAYFCDESRVDMKVTYSWKPNDNN